MKLIADLAKGMLTVNGTHFSISNRIRTLGDGTRQSYEVVCSLPDNRPYDPQPFPEGLWNITGLEWQEEKGFDPQTYGPVKIRTDAWQWVNTWSLDENGDYYKKTVQLVKDHGYLLHYSASTTTLGCLRLASPEDAVQIAEAVQAAFGRYESVQLEVI